MIMTILKVLMVGAYAGLGYAYYYFVGCDTGTCAITSSPVASTAYAAALGAVITFGVVPLIRKKPDEE